MKNRAIAAFGMAFLLMAACMLPLFGLAAGAIDGGANQSVAYYISDDPDSASIANQLMFQGSHPTFQLLTVLARSAEQSGDTTCELLEKCLDFDVFSSYQNAHIIFEITEPFPIQIEDGATPDLLITDLLRSIFSTLKENGCSILFVCPTEEGRFQRHNDFLDYVDVHVNMDTFFIFISSFFYRAYQNNNNSIRYHDTTFVFDFALTENVNQTSLPRDWSLYFRQLIYPHFRLGGVLSTSMGENSKREFFLNNNVKIACQREYDFGSDLAGEQTFDLPRGASAPEISNETVYAVATTLKEDFRYVDAMLEYFGGDLMYLYNPTGYLPFSGALSGTHTFGRILDHIPVLQAFLDGDASAYDNWRGRCNITFKPLLNGSSEWLVDVYSEGDSNFPTDCWDCILTQAMYEFYYGY